jgi:hypothetical protein
MLPLQLVEKMPSRENNRYSVEKMPLREEWIFRNKEHVKTLRGRENNKKGTSKAFVYWTMQFFDKPTTTHLL